MPAQILLTMADLETAVPLNAALEAAGFTTALVSPLDDAPAALRREHPDLLILTGAVHEPSALQLARLARESEVYTLALLEPTDSERGERIQRLGATEVLTKRVRDDDAVAVARRLVERRRLQQHTGISGQSPAVHEVLVKIEQMAPVSSTVLIQGESGTGKELVAKALHDLSPRRGKAFIAVNCAALPETLLESELFGHEKGSFTGAAERRLGRFELAQGGTILLDEIGEVPLSTQVKLLRVLESRSFFRVGGVQPIKVDVRVIAATNRTLRDAVAMGEFREDLFYRLSVLNIYLPPLRERRDDISLLVRRFIREFSRTHDRPFRGITAEALQRLVEAPWPGNIRQLRNLIESMVVLAPGTEIRAADIPADILEGAPTMLPVVVRGLPGTGKEFGSPEVEFILRSLMDLRLQVEELRRRLDHRPGSVQVIEVPEGALTPINIETSESPPPADVVYRPGMTMAEVERAAITAALRECQGNRRQAAARLGIGERTLYRKIKEFKLA
ncbi:MAG TPA: sigma-54 dependent transcriptional regulator [Gemmatimonadales bacterium]|nr:sigma-54 dependent transcriptional regulator [Gemmatimonadales bacterium]